MQVGLNLPASFPTSRLRGAVDLAGRVGASAVWLPDHLLGTFHPELYAESPIGELGGDADAYLDPFCASAAVGAMTDLPVGIAVTDSIRRSSVDTARATLTLHQLCPGGFNIGVGAGEAENLLPFGYPFDRPVGRCEAFLGELRSLLDHGQLPGRPETHIGAPRESGVGPPRIWVAGHGDRMLRLTGTYGDGWMPAWAMSPDAYAARYEVICSHAADVGRPAPEAGLLCFVVLGESRGALAELADRNPLSKLFALYVSGARWASHGLAHPLGAASRGLVDTIVHALDPEELRRLAATIPFDLFCEGVFAGDEGEVAARLAEFERAGCGHVVLANMSAMVGGAAGLERDRFARLCTVVAGEPAVA